MRRFFVKNLLFVLAVNLLVKPVWVFMIDRTVQNRVGHEAYGTYLALFNLGIIFQILLDFGLTNYNSRTISQDPGKLKTLFPAMLTTRILFAGIYASLVYLLAWAVGYQGWELHLLGGVLLIQAINTLMQFLRSNVAALHKFRADGLLSVADRLLMIVLCGFLLFYPGTAGEFTIEWFVMAQVFCYSLAAIIGFLVLRSISNIRLAFTIDVNAVLKIIKSSAPYALLIFMMSVYTRSDAILLERIGGPDSKEQAGIYAAAYRLLDVGNMIGLMFASMLLPLFGRMLANKQDVQPIVKLCVNMLLPVSLMVATAAAFFGSDIMLLLYTAATDYDGVVFAWLMASFPAFCMMYVYSTLLTANGSLKLLNRIALVGVIVNLSLNFVLIPQMQALGAAITSVVTQVVVTLCFIIFAGKNVQLPRNAKWIGAHISYLVLIVVIGYGVTLLPITWMYQLVIFGLACLLLIFVFRFASLKAVKLLMNKG